MNRTVEYERHIEQISNLRQQCVEANTAGRAFDDYAIMLRDAPTMGAIADKARTMLIDFAVRCSMDCRKLIDVNTVLADRLEREGLKDV
jgi:hypothetical protein